MRSLDEFATAKLGELERNSLRRVLVDTTRVKGLWLLRNGRRLLSFSCNDYLNLTHHPAVTEAAVEALRTYGVGAGASRFVTGNHPLYAELEARLARFKDTQAACVFGSGYLANLGIIPALVGPRDLILIDELAHACLWAGARLSGAAVVPYRHVDVGHAETLLAELRRRHDALLVQEIGDPAKRRDVLVGPDAKVAIGVAANRIDDQPFGHHRAGSADRVFREVLEMPVGRQTVRR